MAYVKGMGTPAVAAGEAASPGRALAAGALAGQISGLIMAVVVMAVFTFFLGKGPLFPVQVIGSFIYGDAGLQGFHAGAFIAGLLLHQLGPALFWGLSFGLAAYALNLQRGAGMWTLAVITGVLSQIVDVNIILPWAFTRMQGHDIWAEQVPAFWSWAAHVVYGLGLATYPWVYAKLAPRNPQETQSA